MRAAKLSAISTVAMGRSLYGSFLTMSDDITNVATEMICTENLRIFIIPTFQREGLSALPLP